MSDQIRRGNPSWQKGGPSPNPGGRPRATITAALRELVSPAEVAQFLADTMRNPAGKMPERMAAAQSIYDRFEGRSVSRTELQADITTRAEDPYDDLSDDDLELLERSERAVLRAMTHDLLTTGDPDEPADVVQDDWYQGETVAASPGADVLTPGSEARSPVPAARPAETRSTPDPATAAIDVMARRAERSKRGRSEP